MKNERKKVWEDPKIVFEKVKKTKGGAEQTTYEGVQYHT